MAEMSERLKRHASTMRSLRKASAKRRRQFIESCHPDFVDCMSECSRNLLKENVPVSAGQLKKLRRYKKLLRTIAAKRASVKTRHKLLQKGGFLPLILSPVLGLLSSLVSGAINRRLDRKK
jgi:hypothetical protein